MVAAVLGAVAGSSGGDTGSGGLLGNVFGFNNNQTQQSNGTTDTNTSALSDAQVQSLNALIGNLTSSNDQYSRANAQADAQGFAQKELLNLKEVGLPGIASQEKTAGSFNATGGQELAQNLEAQTAADVATNTQNVITNYANIQNQNNAVLAQLYSILKGAQTTSETTTNQTINANENNSGGTWGQLTGSLSHGLGQVGHVGSSLVHGIEGFF